MLFIHTKISKTIGCSEKFMVLNTHFFLLSIEIQLFVNINISPNRRRINTKKATARDTILSHQ